jgi:hypothetical protein
MRRKYLQPRNRHYKTLEQAMKSKIGHKINVFVIPYRAWIMAALLATSMAAGDAQQNKQSHFTPVDGSYAELSGTTNVGKWTSRSTTILGSVLIAMDTTSLDAVLDKIKHDGDADCLPMSLWDPTAAQLLLPVASLNGGSQGIEDDLQTALKSNDYPFIKYVVQRLDNVRVIRNGDTCSLAFAISGKLSMAGEDHPLAMNLLIQRTPDSHFHVEAKTHLLMSDFGVTPPTALFGLIRARNNVDVLFNLEFGQRKSPDGVETVSENPLHDR